VVQAPRRPRAGRRASLRPAAAPPRSETRVDPGRQRARDSDARRILQEAAREEERLAEMQKEFNNGEPERRGDERNYQRYLDRVAEMKAAIAAQGSRHRRPQARAGQAAAVSGEARAVAEPTTARPARGFEAFDQLATMVAVVQRPTAAACFVNATLENTWAACRAARCSAATCSTGWSTRAAARHAARWPQRGGHQPLRRPDARAGGWGPNDLPVHVIVSQTDRPTACWWR
jgi:hypothetical protein